MVAGLAKAYALHINANPHASQAYKRKVTADGYTDEMEPTKKQRREQENRDCIGGMRNAAQAVARIPGWRSTGALLRATIEKYLDVQGGPLVRAIEVMGRPEARGPPEEWILGLRQALAGALRVGVGAEEGLQGWLAQAVGQLAGDPDKPVT